MEEIIEHENSENVDGATVPPATNLHNCPKCSRTFVNIGHMKCHFYRVHPEFKLTDFVKTDIVTVPVPGKTCNSCKLVFKTKKMLNTHNCSFSSEDKLYQCDQCDASFTQNSALLRHCFKAHRKARDHICDVCQSGFTSPTKLTAHMRIHELEKVCKSDSSDHEDEEEIPLADDDFDDEEAADAPEDEVIENSPKFVCEVCDQGFRTSTSLKSHALTHEKMTYMCEVCNECFSDLHDLKKHTLSRHPAEKLFVCDICKASFRAKAALGRHSRVHREDKAHFCEICNMSLPTKQALVVHLRKHAKVKPYACTKCDKTFGLKCHLARHIPSHDQLPED